MTARAMFVGPDGGEPLDVLGTPMKFLATEADTGGLYEVVMVAPEGAGEPLAHRHPWPEFYLVLEGTLEVTVGARTHLATTGSFVAIPARAIHSFTVVSEGARFLHVSFGPGATAAFREYHDAVPGVPEPDDIPRLLAINERHGVEVVLPGIGTIRSLDDLARLGDLSELEEVSDLGVCATS